MRRILAHTTRSREVEDGFGSKQVAEEVESVTFLDHNGAAHTLTFHPHGTNVAGKGEGDNAVRKVGEDSPAYSYATPQEAVDAYENGEIV